MLHFFCKTISSKNKSTNYCCEIGTQLQSMFNIFFPLSYRFRITVLPDNFTIWLEATSKSVEILAAVAMTNFSNLTRLLVLWKKKKNFWSWPKETKSGESIWRIYLITKPCPSTDPTSLPLSTTWRMDAFFMVMSRKRRFSSNAWTDLKRALLCKIRKLSKVILLFFVKIIVNIFV